MHAPATWADLGALLSDEGDELVPVCLPHCDPDAVRADAPCADGGVADAGARARDTQPLLASKEAAAQRRTPDPWSLDLVICDGCERTVLRSAFAAHAAICVETPADSDPLFGFRSSPAAAHGAQPSAGGGTQGARKGEPALGGKLKKQKLLTKPLGIPSTACADAAGAAVGRGGGRGAGVRGVGGKVGSKGAKTLPLFADAGHTPGATMGRGAGGKGASKLGRGRGLGGAACTANGAVGAGTAMAQTGAAAERAAAAAAHAALAPDPDAAERLRRSEAAMLRAQWLSLVSLLKAPPDPPAPLVDRETVLRQLRPRARVVPLPAEPAQAALGAAVSQAAVSVRRTQPAALAAVNA